MAAPTKQPLSTQELINGVLGFIEREREREIISRRFGLFERKETLEQIGELLGITRERVRQLEKMVMQKLKAAGSNNSLPGIDSFQKIVLETLEESGQAMRISKLTSTLISSPNRVEQSRVAFLCDLCKDLLVIQDDDTFHASVTNAKIYDKETIKADVDVIVNCVTKAGEPLKIDKLATLSGIKDKTRVEALANLSKNLTSLNGVWGLVKWPLVNPKNIRDNIYVILKSNGKHMHFNEIAEAIKNSEFKRRDVTTQAIHNELIKDKRFVLIGRGIYALKEWGYEKGTVADIIGQILREANQPLHKDEIVQRVLKCRFVKETTILLNLQGKEQFHRVAKATYELVEAD